MALQAYRSTNFRPDSQDRIQKIVDILEEYPDQKLTARQVYYQFVSRGWLENNVKNYKNLTSLLTDARYAGLVDWEVIEDRGREPSTPNEFTGLESLVDAALRSYRLPRWEGQENYVELWVEKQALAGVLAPIARKYHVTLMVNKGYSSASAMKQAADRMREACGFESPEFAELEEECNAELEGLDHESKEYKEGTRRWGRKIAETTRKPILLYLGDHDPSGEDMVRDIGERLKEFKVWRLEVRKLALTMAQIRKFNPPPNPAKITDSRAKAYIAKYGEQSWELDALPPKELNRLIERAFLDVLDKVKMDAIIRQEEADKAKLRRAVNLDEEE